MNTWRIEINGTTLDTGAELVRDEAGTDHALFTRDQLHRFASEVARTASDGAVAQLQRAGRIRPEGHTAASEMIVDAAAAAARAAVQSIDDRVQWVRIVDMPDSQIFFERDGFGRIKGAVAEKKS